VDDERCATGKRRIKNIHPQRGYPSADGSGAAGAVGEAEASQRGWVKIVGMPRLLFY